MSTGELWNFWGKGHPIMQLETHIKMCKPWKSISPLFLLDSVYSFLLISLIHLYLGFFQCNIYGSSCILPHEVFQLDYHICRRCLVLLFYILASLSKSIVNSFVYLILVLWFAYLYQPVCFYASTMHFYCYCFAVQIEIRDIIL